MGGNRNPNGSGGSYRNNTRQGGVQNGNGQNRRNGKNAKTVYSLSKQSYFVNPYNFVPVSLNKKGVSDLKDENSSLHTGVLYCRILTKTPLAVPDVESMKLVNTDDRQPKAEHKQFDFFHYKDGIPVIPGSTLRGAIRSVYETITDSCFSTTKEDAFISSRSNQAFAPGVLLRDESGKWKLYAAKRYLIKIQEYESFNQDDGQCLKLSKEDLKVKKIGFGSKVYFRPVMNGREERDYKKKDRYLVGTYVSNFRIKKPGDKKKAGEKEGYLYIGEYFKRKHFESIFYIDSDNRVEVEIENPDSAVKRLQETVKIYRDSKVNRNYKTGENPHTGYSEFEQAYEKGAIPVWYDNYSSKGGKQKARYLTIACLGRRIYINTLGDVVGKLVPCTSRKRLCKACALFGMASEEKVGSRVRISDAVLSGEPKDALTGFVTLQELAGPKISYLPFYTKKPMNIPQWSYDQVECQIRGRKFYWHSEFNGKPQKKTQRNATMKLVKADKEFTFQVYYDHITENQLEELIWTLTLGENQEDSSYCYKIGHGKPLGLGSAKIVIDRQVERDFKDGYQIKENEIIDVKDVFKDNNTKKALLKIMNRESTKGMHVSYPSVEKIGLTEGELFTENDLASHQWFGYNYKMGSKEVKWVLPEITKQNITLPILEARKGQ